ncbi:MAG: hypothetical protein AAF682_16525 [Planctomycetota bacterium]
MTQGFSREVAGRYEELLEGKHLATTAKAMVEADRGMYIDTDEVPLRPVFLSPAVHEGVMRSATLVMRGLNAVADHLLSSAEARRRIRLTAAEERMVATDPRPGEIVGRLDGILDQQGEIRFVEYNTRPGSVVKHIRLSDTFTELPIFEELGAQAQLKPTFGRSGFRFALESLKSRFDLGPTPMLTAVGEPGDVTGSDVAPDALYIGQALDEAGFQAELVPFRELTCREGRLYRGDRIVRAAYVMNWHTFPDEVPFEHDFWGCVKSGELMLLNSGAGQVLRAKKDVFAVLRDGSLRHLLDDDVAEAVERYIPWTHIVEEREVDFHGVRAGLRQLLYDNGPRMVLKPTSGYGGQGVVLGWACTPDEWREHVDAAFEAPFVVQERVMLFKESFPWLVNGRPQREDFYIDLNPFVWNTGRVEGCMARVSPTEITNECSGGGASTAVFIAQELAAR